MATARRKARPKYRSGLEKVIGLLFQQGGVEAAHEAEVLTYIQPAQKRRYTVDFTLKAAPSLIVEAKGRFTSQDRKKMLLIKEQYPDRQIVMVFGNARNRLSKISGTTYGDWCDRNGIAWIEASALEDNPRCLLSLAKTKAGSSTVPVQKKKKPCSKSAR